MKRPAADTDAIDELRSELYERGKKDRARARTPLTRTRTRPVSRDWSSAAASSATTTNRPPLRKKHTTYRYYLLAAGAGFFFVALILSSTFLFFGASTISGDNISITIDGPFAARGGEVLPLTIAVANRNTVPIESATLIIEYPSGTQSAREAGVELFSQRVPLEAISAGSIVTVPVQAIVFGEENQQQEIRVAVEYRVAGSNATFYTEAEPLSFTISSSPVSLSLSALERISAGQETELALAVTSNAPTLLSDLVVVATYPFGFEFLGSSVPPSAARDTWVLEALAPGETATITVRGTFSGNEGDVQTVSFAAGVASERDPFVLSSPLAASQAELLIEQPFLDIEVLVNGNSAPEVVVRQDERTDVRVTLRNTLDRTLYDGTLSVSFAGSGVGNIAVDARSGFYQEAARTISWDAVGEAELREIAPGRAHVVSFTITPQPGIGATPEVLLSFAAAGRRVSQDNVPQQLAGTTKRTLRVESEVAVTSQTLHATGPFENAGPVPPAVGETTEYTLSFAFENGGNDVADAVMRATLPPHVAWLDFTSARDSVVYTPSRRELRWDIGDVPANTHQTLSVKVSLTPSAAQAGRSPTLIERQRVTATDRFTGTGLRAEAPALTTSLLTERTAPRNSGRVKEVADE